MMIHGLSLIPRSDDPEALDQLISTEIIPALKVAPGLQGVAVNAGEVMAPGGPPRYARVVEFSFSSLEEMMGWVQMPEAEQARDRLQSMGATLLFYEVASR